MNYKINKASNIYDLNTIIKEHYHLNELEFEKLQTFELTNPKNLTNIESCLNILRDILVKNRAEVIDMFLTTFDRKMYEEALREEGRDEMIEET